MNKLKPLICPRHTNTLEGAYQDVSRLCKIMQYKHTYIHTYLPTYIHTYIHTYISTNLHTYLPNYLTYRPTDLPTYLHSYIPTYLHTYTSVACLNAGRFAIWNGLRFIWYCLVNSATKAPETRRSLQHVLWNHASSSQWKRSATTPNLA